MPNVVTAESFHGPLINPKTPVYHQTIGISPRIAGSTPHIFADTIADGNVGVVYSQTISDSGGPSPYTWSIITGTLPAGLSLNAATGVISGTPTTAGSSTFTIKVVDANGSSATQSFTLKIDAGVASVCIVY